MGHAISILFSAPKPARLHYRRAGDLKILTGNQRRIAKHTIAITGLLVVMLGGVLGLAWALGWIDAFGPSATVGLFTVLCTSLLAGVVLETYRRLVDHGNFKAAQTQDHSAILALVQPRLPLPTMNNAAMTPDALMPIVRVVLTDRPRTILELGAGVSTLALGYLLERLDYGGRIVSVENHKDYFDYMTDLVTRHGLERTITLVYAPLRATAVRTATRHTQQPWYDFAYDADRWGLIDLLIVDEPPGTLVSQSRYPALPQLHRFLSPTAKVVLDDARRADETAIAAQWSQEFDFSAQLIPSEWGTAVLERQPTV